jgi:hypothetical protein
LRGFLGGLAIQCNFLHGSQKLLKFARTNPSLCF